MCTWNTAVIHIIFICRQAPGHPSPPPLTSLTWYHFLRYHTQLQPLLATARSRRRYPAELLRSVSFVNKPIFLAIFVYSLDVSLTLYGKLHSLSSLKVLITKELYFIVLDQLIIFNFIIQSIY